MPKPTSLINHKVTTKITNGFTLIELLVVVAIIGILAAIGIISYSGSQIDSRNSQRSSKITVVSEALEKYYDENGEYPSCAALTTDVSTITTKTLNGLDPEALTTPSGTKGTSSFLSSCNVNPSGLSTDTFAYVGGTTQYTLQYKKEGTGETISLKSRREVATGTTYALTLAASPVAGGTTTGAGTHNSGSTQTITANANANYSFVSWVGETGCSGAASHTIVMDTAKTCTAYFTPTTIAIPATPTVTVTQPTGLTTAYTWGAASCPGNTARYQYRYTISPAGSDSFIVSTDSTSVTFTTSVEGQTYTVAVQAECYNAAAASGMSAAGSGSYLRPITYKTLTTVAGTGGTVSASGSFVTGSTQTITATANSGYLFNTWTGDTGCSGAASHTITMDANKSCTANFTATPISAPSAPTVSANTVGATTTWSWGAASCPGNTARYQYKFTYNPGGYDSGWLATASTSVGFTTSTEGVTYTVTVQAQCYNAVTTSAWSGSGSANYTRPITYYTLTTAAGAGGTVSAGGSYASGSTPTITATPNANYNFNSWTGSTGCSGVASHTITMDANKSCTANFTASGYTLTLNYSGSGSVSGGGTYASGSTPTMTSSPSGGYLFSYWSGSTGCSGVASHTITMNANKSCTAYFIPPFTKPGTPVITYTNDGSYTRWSWTINPACPSYSTMYSRFGQYIASGGSVYWVNNYTNGAPPLNLTNTGSLATMTLYVLVKCIDNNNSLNYSVDSDTGSKNWP